MRLPAASLYFNHHSSSASITEQSIALEQRLLGAICFGEPCSNPTIDLPMLHIPAQADSSLCEIWFSDNHAAVGEYGAIRYRHDGNWMFGVIEIPEPENTGGALPLQQTAESAYRQIFALLDKLQYPRIYRFWNYMRDINGVTYGLERYRQFNLGRQQAFIAYGREIEGDLPAACALGLESGSLTIAFLAGRFPAMAIENPRQISAYDYPEEYGPRSPTFSRAVLLAEQGILFISGTASIVGHSTQHVGDIGAQTRETLANLLALIAEANQQSDQQFDSGKMLYRVYLRHSKDQPVVQAEISTMLGPHVQAMFVQADICRQDLLVEIEATAYAQGIAAP